MLCNGIQKSLNNNLELCYVMAYLNKNSISFSKEDNVMLDTQINIRQLKSVEEMDPNIDLSKEFQCVKQRNEKWHKIRSKCLISASSSYSALGLRTLKRINYINLCFEEQSERFRSKHSKKT